MKRIIATLAIAMMMCGGAAWAVPPERLPIMVFEGTGSPFADCGDFFILNDYKVSLEIIQYFNADGSLNREFYKFRPSYDVYFNSQDPSYWLSSTLDPIQRWLYFRNGEPYWATASNNFTITAPGYGVVMQLHHRLRMDWTTGEVVFEKGPNDLWAGNFDAICAALRVNP